MKYSESQALAKVAAYCSKAERSEFDIRRKLQGWGLEEDTISNIVKRLKLEKFLNDERFCRAFIKDKLKFNKWGKTKIIFELRRKQISRDIIETCFSEFDFSEFDEQLASILKSKIKSIKAKDDYEKRTKLIRFALGRGFSLEQTKKILDTILESNNEDYFP